jgi:GTP diphosphokinase / guanosine-3',5'-bis(diphosphate) 3'-diphosphatase
MGVLTNLPLVRRGDTPAELEGLAAAIRTAGGKADVRDVVRAYRYAHEMHDGQTRRSGEAYITHPVAVATELAELGLGTATIVAALLHDVVEDTRASLQDIETGFGAEVAHLVDGVTKLDRLRVESKEEQQAETLRKMIMAMAKDIRVLVIKLADRLHNMETIGSMPREKQKRIAQETLDIYAPLAHRLGMQQFKLRLEDLGFKTLHPKRYDEIVAMVEDRNPEREAYLDEVVASIRDQLRELKVRGDVFGRPKHYFSIYEKMVLRGKEFDEIYDLIGVRVIVNSVRDCYAVLGQLHASWRPVPGRFKDYIAMPKVNLYQSLHTSVIGPKGRPLEVQIRTRAMHRTAEFGVAAHWMYKDAHRGNGGDADATGEMPWIDQLLEWQSEVEEPGDYLESLKIDLYADEVFVFTPKGDVMGLPAGATPIDFAYAVHTEVGHRCIGARVNGRLVPLEHQLVNGDVIEVLTSKAEDAGPSRDWLKLAASTRAQSKIRAYFNRERREDAIGRGREAITRALRRKGIAYARVMASGQLTDAASELNYKGTEALFRAVGEGHLAAGTVVGQVVAALTDVVEDERDVPDLPAKTAPIRIGQGAGDDITVEGDAGMLVQLARCCTPVPGDDIVGFVTRGRGVSVHRNDCPNVADLRDREDDRFVPVDWSGEHTASFLVQVQIEALDRKHLLRDITAVLGDLHINITSATVATRKDRVAVLRFQFELGDPTHLEYALRSVRRVEGVYDAYRVVPQTNSNA